MNPPQDPTKVTPKDLAQFHRTGRGALAVLRSELWAETLQEATESAELLALALRSIGAQMGALGDLLQEEIDKEKKKL